MALIYFNSIIDEQSPFGVPNACIIWMKYIIECCQGRLKDEWIPHEQKNFLVFMEAVKCILHGYEGLGIKNDPAC